MAQGNNNDTSNRGLSPDSNMSQEDRERIHSEGGKASAKSSKGAAGKTEAAKRGGENSHRND